MSPDVNVETWSGQFVGNVNRLGQGHHILIFNHKLQSSNTDNIMILSNLMHEIN